MQNSTAQHMKERRGEEKMRQSKARQGKARQGKARQGKARQGKARQGKAIERVRTIQPQTQDTNSTHQHSTTYNVKHTHSDVTLPYSRSFQCCCDFLHIRCHSIVIVSGT